MATRPPYEIRILSLASGIGGLDRGVERALRRAGFAPRVVCYVEREAHAAALLVARMAEGRMDQAPIWSDLRTFDARRWRGCVDLIVGGYSCVSFSSAGKRLGFDDERNIWPAFLRIVSEIDPVAVFCENVAAHTTLGLQRVVEEMAGLGYGVQAVVAKASDVGAPHKRDRIFWLGLAHAGDGGRGPSFGDVRSREPHALGHDAHGRDPSVADTGCSRQQRRGGAGDVASAAGDAGGEAGERERSGGAAGDRSEGVANASSDGRGQGRPEWEGQQREHALVDGGGGAPFPPGPDDADGWRAYLAEWPGTEPAVRRDDDGLSNRVDRLRALGNAVVPAQAERAFEILAFGRGVGEQEDDGGVR